MSDKTGMLAAVAQAAGLDASAPVNLTAALVAQHFPAVAAELKADGAKAERERLAGIEAQAMPGHGKIIDAMKADPGKTGADAAMAILAAEKSARAAQLAALDADEAKIKGLRSQPANGMETAADDGKAALAGLKGEALWKAEYDRDDRLQAEFGSQASYVALRKAEQNGLVKRLKNRRDG